MSITDTIFIKDCAIFLRRNRVITVNLLVTNTLF